VRDLATGQVGMIVAVGRLQMDPPAPAAPHPLDYLIDAVAERVEERLAERRRAEGTPTRLVPVREAASVLGRSMDAVYKMVARGEIHAVKRPGGHRVMIELREIERYIARNRTATVS
jgi:excisionase family DNA binding protein